MEYVSEWPIIAFQVQLVDVMDRAENVWFSWPGLFVAPLEPILGLKIILCRWNSGVCF